MMILFSSIRLAALTKRGKNEAKGNGEEFTFSYWDLFSSKILKT